MWLYLVNIYTDVGTFECIVLAMVLAVGVLAYMAFTFEHPLLKRRQKKHGAGKLPKM